MQKNSRNRVIADRFLSVRDIKDLANLLGMPPNILLHIAKTPHYSSFKIPKDKGGSRSIDAPDSVHNYIQRKLNKYIQEVYLLYRPAEVHGFIHRPAIGFPDINVKSNASVHVGQAYVLNLDLKDFFHSITAGKVRGVFMAAPFNFSREIASLLSVITTWHNRLPMGAPTSPVISNFVCYMLDEKLRAVAGKHEYLYTRYADDITFSGEAKPDGQLIKMLSRDIESEGFEINRRKIRVQSRSMRQVVTGISVNEKPNLPRSYYRNLRAILYNWEHKGLMAAVSKYYCHLPPPYTEYQGKFLKSVWSKILYLEYIRGKDNELAYKLKVHFRKNLVE